MDDKEIESRFIEGEQRLGVMLHNLWKFGRSDSPNSSASWKAATHYLVSTVLSPSVIGAGFVAFMTVFLAYRANELLDSQNRLAESSRQAAGMETLAPLFDNIESEIRSLIPRSEIVLENTIEQQAPTINVQNPSGEQKAIESLREVLLASKPVLMLDQSSGPQVHEYRYVLSNQLYARIAAISHSFVPVPNPRSNRIALSGERSALIRMLLFSGVDMSAFHGGVLNLQKADLRDAKLERYDLSGLDLDSSDFSRASMQGSKFCGARLRLAVFLGTNLMSADFARTVLPSPESFAGADLTDINLFEASVSSKDWLEKVSKVAKNFIKEDWVIRKIAIHASGISRTGHLPMLETFDPADFGDEWEIVPSYPDRWPKEMRDNSIWTYRWDGRKLVILNSGNQAITGVLVAPPAPPAPPAPAAPAAPAAQAAPITLK